MFESLSVRPFRRYMIGFVGSGMAFTNQQVAQGWLAYDLTKSSKALGEVLLFNGLAMGITSMIGGVLADRFDRRATIVSMQSIAAVSALIVGLLVSFHAIELWHMYLYASVSGAVVGLHLPSRQAFVYNVVGKDRIANATAVNIGSNNAMRLMAPVLAGYLIGWVGVGAVYFSVVAGFAISIIVMVFFVGPTRQEYTSSRESPLKALAGGFTYLWGYKTFFWIVMLLLLVTTIGMPYRDLMPAFAKEALGQDPHGYGLLLSMIGLGALLGSLVIAFLSDRAHKGRGLVLMGIGFGLLCMLFSQMPTMATAMIVLIFLGAASTAFNTFGNIILQTRVDDAHRGRIASFYLLSFSAQPVGSIFLGTIADTRGVREAYLWAGVGVLAIVLVVAAWRRDIRRTS